jgi:hypothetical protein
MTGNDLIMLAPWVIFGAGLAVVWLRLRRSRLLPLLRGQRRYRRAAPGARPEPVPPTAGPGPINPPPGPAPGRRRRGARR